MPAAKQTAATANKNVNVEDENSKDEDRVFITRGKQTAVVEGNDCGVNYLPDGALAITKEQRIDWAIKNADYFHIYYESKGELMNAFMQDLEQRGYETDAAKQHANNVDLIWTILDNTYTIFPKNVLANKYALQDKYHRPAKREIGRGCVEANTLRTRYTSLKFFVTFLRKRGIAHMIAWKI